MACIFLSQKGRRLSVFLSVMRYCGCGLKSGGLATAVDVTVTRVSVSFPCLLDERVSFDSLVMFLNVLHEEAKSV